MIARRLAALVALTLAVARVVSPQGTPSLVVRVVERTTQQPLPNAEVIDLDGGARRFTNDEGETRLAWGPTGRLRLRVRQLGFQFVDQDVKRSASQAAAGDTVVVTLGRVAYTLPEVTTRENGCSPDADSVTKALSVVALSQLSMGAERYDAFRNAYPFQIRQKRRTVRFNPDGTAREVRESSEEATSKEWSSRSRASERMTCRGGSRGSRRFVRPRRSS